MIASAIAGGAAGLSVAGKMGVRRLKGKFGRGGGAEASLVIESVHEGRTDSVS
jgi:hypothetical protein